MPILGPKPVPEEEPEPTTNESSNGKFTMRWIKDLTHKSFSLSTKTSGKKKNSGWSVIRSRIRTENSQTDQEEEIQHGNFSYEQIKAATKDFRPAYKIGEGGFGSVYMGVLTDGRAIAVKVISPESLQGKKEFLNEINAMSRYKHPNIVTLLGHCVAEDNRFIPFLVDFCSNISFTNEPCKFHSSFNVRRGYIAPEYVIQGYLTEKADVYGFGVLVLELISGRRCVDISKDSPPLLEFAKVLQKKRNLISLLDQDLTNIPRNEATMVLDLAMLCTSHSPKARPNISDVVKILEGKNVLYTPAVMQELDDLAGVTSDEMTLSDFSYNYMDSCRKEIVKHSNIGERADYSRSSMMSTNFPTSETPISNVNASSTSTTLEKNITEMAAEAELEFIEPQLEEGKYRIECSNEEFKIGCSKWKNSLVGYLLNENGAFDKEVDEAILRETIPAGNGYSVFSIGSGHYLFQFSCVEDKIRGLESSGLLRVQGKPLVLIKWDWKLTLDKAETMKSIPLWVKIYNLPLFLWNLPCLSKVVSAFGIPICADQKTIKQQRLDYARIYMKVDARKPLLGSFLISVKGVDYLLKLEYDWKPLRCTGCFTFGHTESECKLQIKVKQD
ncbi:hypothetical protein MKW92_010004 [Papaver armeniacum]|nr:hypothetical protein MKW92_010004 [Papaver armeniacum]